MAPAGVWAKELTPLYRSPQIMAMGGTATAWVENEEAIFYNPAGLAGNEAHEVHYARVDMETSDAIVVTAQEGVSAFSSFKNLNLSRVNILMGKNVYGRFQFSPTLVLPYFGVSFLTDAQIAMYIKNKAYPETTLGYMNTNGVQTAFGFKLGGRRKKGRPELRIGFGPKLMWRRGGYNKLSPMQLLDLVERKRTALGELIGNFGMAIGGDLGTQFVLPIHKTTKFIAGGAWSNIGDLSFGEKAMVQKNNLSFGVALKYEHKWFGMMGAVDHSNILAVTDWKQRNHFGFGVDLPFISLYGGMNQAFLTYGAAFDIWFFKMTLASYGQELGTNLNQDPSRRYMLRLDLSFPL